MDWVAPDGKAEVFLNAGDFYFLHRSGTSGQAEPRVRTLLGSCVSMVLWHPQQRLGGMCHFILPRRHAGQNDPGRDGRYGDGAMELFLRELQRNRTRPEQYRVCLTGGGRMSLGARVRDDISVGARNVETARQLLRQHGFTISGEHVGQEGHRKVVFDLANGKVEITYANRVIALCG